jgi:alanine racemase
MLRLGDFEEEAHHVVGMKAAECVDYLITRGERAAIIAEAARQAGLSAAQFIVTSTHEDAARSAHDLIETVGARFIAPPSGGGDGSAIMAFNKITGSSVGADLSRPSPIYRPSGQSTTSLHQIVKPHNQIPSAAVLIKGSEETRMEWVTERLMAQPEEARERLVRQTPGWKQIVVMRPERPTWVEIDLSAIGNNTRLLASIVGPRVRILASLKADAYGHGALKVARTVLHNGASMLGVATVSEAMPLREAGINAPILVFGYAPPWQMREAVHLGLTIALYSLESAKALTCGASSEADRQGTRKGG